MKICILTPYAEPEKGACVIRVDYFARHFSEKGHEVLVLAPARADTEEATGVKRYKGITEMTGIISRGKFDAVIGTSPPMTHNFFALAAARISGAKFIIDAKDPFVYMYSKSGKKNLFKVLFYSLLEKLTLENSDFILTLNPYNKRKILEAYKIPEEKITVAMNGTDTNVVKKDEKAGAETRKSLGISAKQKVLIYSGCLGGKDLNGFVDAIGKSGLAKKYDLAFIFMLTHDGTKQTNREFDSFGKKLNWSGLIERARIVKNVGYNEVGKYFSAADIGINSMADYDTYCFPVKVMDYIACGLPIASKSPEGNEDLHAFIDSRRIGFHENGWPGFTKKIDKLLENPEEIKKISANAAKASQELSREKTCKAVIKIIEELIAGQ